MPITEFQSRLFKLLEANRNPNSYVAGGTAIHRKEGSSRYSNDVDFFHDTDEAVWQSVGKDFSVLEKHGYTVKKLLDQPGLVRAVASKAGESLKLEWVRDTAFRFFPIIKDDQLGYRLHDVDLAVNKCIALANRHEVRDLIDLIELEARVLCLSGICWAACGKDPGFTPELLLDYMNRHSAIRPEQLAAESLTKTINPVELKRKWLDLMSTAVSEVQDYPVSDLGCIYIDKKGEVIQKPRHPLPTQARAHFGSLGGSWPVVRS